MKTCCIKVTGKSGKHSRQITANVSLLDTKIFSSRSVCLSLSHSVRSAMDCSHKKGHVTSLHTADEPKVR